MILPTYPPAPASDCQILTSPGTHSILIDLNYKGYGVGFIPTASEDRNAEI